MPGRRIFYHCPRADSPSGGVLTIYRHVEALVRGGFDAFVLHRRQGAPLRWFDSTAPVATLDSGLAPRPPDVLVIPEGSWRLMAETAESGLERVVFAQGWSYIYRGLSEGSDWRTWGIREVMAVSRYVQRFLRRTMGLPSALVHPGIDLELFRPAAKRLQIACMPRKNPGDLQQIRSIFRSRFPRYGKVPFVLIDGMSQRQTAEALAESAVFLATGYPEGCPLPPLEALASGCLVVGFAGRGGREYLRHGENCLLAADGDVLGAAERLGRAIELLLGAAADGAGGRAPEAPEAPEPPATGGAGGGAEALRSAGLATAARFSLARSERAVLSFWRRHGAGAGAPAATASGDGAGRARRWVGMARRVAVLSVHYCYPELLADQLARLERCVGPTREALGLRLELFVIVHRHSLAEVVAAAAAGCAARRFATCLDVGQRLPAEVRKGGQLHGRGLAAGLAELQESVGIEPDDLVVLLDHDAHPLDVRLFARLGEALREREELAAIGIPQWHRGHCYLHPSLLATRAATIFEMGTRAAFEVRLPPTKGSDDWHDTAEGFTAWCERHRRALLPLRVNSTRFPWTRWDSDMVPGGGACLTGEHGEPVQVGNLMHYGLDAAASLASHVWAGPLGPFRWLGLSDHDRETVFAAYLAEPLVD
jgi:Glycosyl transferases group 1